MKKLLTLCLTFIMLFSFAACTPGADETDPSGDAGTEQSAPAIQSADDLAGKKIGVQMGTTGDIYVSDDFESEGSTNRTLQQRR